MTRRWTRGWWKKRESERERIRKTGERESETERHREAWPSSEQQRDLCASARPG